MNQHRSRTVTVLLAALVLVGAANLGAFAATGGPLLLGKSNTASKTTTLKTTGTKPALSLKSKAGKAPLKVSNDTKVAKLNADKLDGLDSSGLKTTSYVYDLTAVGISTAFVNFTLGGLPPGRYAANFSVVATTTDAMAFACYLFSGTGASVKLSVIGNGTNPAADNWFASASGYLDTTTVAHRFGCQRSGGGPMTIPPTAQYESKLVLTRIDDATVTTAPGVGATAFKPLVP